MNVRMPKKIMGYAVISERVKKTMKTKEELEHEWLMKKLEKSYILCIWKCVENRLDKWSNEDLQKLLDKRKDPLGGCPWRSFKKF